MEKNNKTIENNNINENLCLTNRKNLKIDGIVEIISSSENLLNIKLKDTFLVVNGQNMHICKLDITSGLLEVEGLIESIKYGKTMNLFKRIFK